MLRIQENYPLKELNTFGVEASARWYAEIEREADLATLFSDPAWQEKQLLILGGGSNMLFTKNFEGLVIRLAIGGIEYRIQEDKVYVTAGAGVIWNDLVNYCVSRGFAGLENLSLIPGTVGASPVQNIGAYGTELDTVFYSCRAFEIAAGTMKAFDKSDCRFSYRDSVFKNLLKDKYIITEVTYILTTAFAPNITYGAIQEELNRQGISEPAMEDVSKVVSQIRVSKLPDPSMIGNAGSFFKNPLIPVGKFRQLQSVFPDIIHYPAGYGTVKLAAGWMIEQCGWKGVRHGDTGTWKNQALVLVNHGQATGKEVFDLSAKIIESVKNKFGVVLEREVNII